MHGLAIYPVPRIADQLKNLAVLKMDTTAVCVLADCHRWGPGPGRRGQSLERLSSLVALDSDPDQPGLPGDVVRVAPPGGWVIARPVSPRPPLRRPGCTDRPGLIAGESPCLLSSQPRPGRLVVWQYAGCVWDVLPAFANVGGCFGGDLVPHYHCPVRAAHLFWLRHAPA